MFQRILPGTGGQQAGQTTLASSEHADASPHPPAMYTTYMRQILCLRMWDFYSYFWICNTQESGEKYINAVYGGGGGGGSRSTREKKRRWHYGLALHKLATMHNFLHPAYRQPPQLVSVSPLTHRQPRARWPQVGTYSYVCLASTPKFMPSRPPGTYESVKPRLQWAEQKSSAPKDLESVVVSRCTR